VDDFAFPSSVLQMAPEHPPRLVHEWVTAIDLTPAEYGTHSLSRTKASLIYKATGNLRAIRILLGHSKLENTLRYLGVDASSTAPAMRPTEISPTGMSAPALR
jgi:site-specific recombinase XerD